MVFSNELKSKLDSKIEKEYEQFIEELRKEPFEKIVEKSYEITLKQEVKDYICSCESFGLNELRTMLEHKNLLSELYDSWINADGSLFEKVDEVFDKKIDELTSNYFKKLRNREVEVR